MAKEIRTLGNSVEIRSDAQENYYIAGYALKFGIESQDLGGFVEIIDRNALNETNLSDVRALVNHDPNMVLGRTTSNTLKLEIDDIGLKYFIFPPKTSYARDLIESMRRGDINQSSFSFIVDENDGDEWVFDEEREIYVRYIKRIKQVFDVSVVTFPAYSPTESIVAQRSLEKFKDELNKQLQKRKLLIELDLIG